MTKMTTVPIRGTVAYSSTVSSTTHTFSLPAGCKDGDLAYVTVDSVFTTGQTQSLPGWTLVQGGITLNASTQHSLWKRTLTAADSGTSSTVTLSLAGATSVGGIVVSGAEESVSTAVSKTTKDLIYVTPAFTPVAANALAIVMVGEHFSSAASPTTGTPCTGWTRSVASATPNTAIVAGVVVDTKQLSGQAGTAQAAGTGGAWGSTSRSAMWTIVIAPPDEPPPPVAAPVGSPAVVRGYISAASAAETGPALTKSFQMPFGLAAGDVALLTTSHVGNGITATLPGWSQVGAPVVLNAATTQILWKKTAVAPSDSGSTQTITFASAASVAIGGLVLRGTVDTQGSPLTKTVKDVTQTVPGFTPVADNALAILLVSGHHSAGDPVGYTPATGWTSKVSSSWASASFSQVEVAVDTKTLTGQGGVAQAALADAAYWNGLARSVAWVITAIAPTGGASDPGLGVFFRIRTAGALTPSVMVRL